MPVGAYAIKPALQRAEKHYRYPLNSLPADYAGTIQAAILRFSSGAKHRDLFSYLVYIVKLKIGADLLYIRSSASCVFPFRVGVPVGRLKQYAGADAQNAVV